MVFKKERIEAVFPTWQVGKHHVVEGREGGREREAS